MAEETKNPVIFTHKTISRIENKELIKLAQTLQPEIKDMHNVSLSKYKDDGCSINLPFDEKISKQVKKLAKEKLKLNPEYIVVVGIGGSNLGTIAVQEAITGKLHNQLIDSESKTLKKLSISKILYADTVDSTQIKNIIRIIEPCLKKGRKIIINGISKSGTTTETIANFQILIDIIKKYHKKYSDMVVVTSDKGSKFWNFGEKNNFSVLEIPKKVGGRYSVFSAVGLFPLAMVGINIDNLLRGARVMRQRCLNTKWQDNPAAVSAMIRYIHYKNKKNIHDLFLFKPNLESIGKWFRQLMGESIGKETNLNNKIVNEGITPTVSVGSTDLHSMAQLYLGGPYDKFTVFVEVIKSPLIRVQPSEACKELAGDIQGKNVSEIMAAILKGTKSAFRKKERPFVEITLFDSDEFCIGQLLQMFMIEMMYLGKLLNVNPFDQPSVEAYKIETRKNLGR